MITITCLIAWMLAGWAGIGLGGGEGGGDADGREPPGEDGAPLEAATALVPQAAASAVTATTNAGTTRSRGSNHRSGLIGLLQRGTRVLRGDGDSVWNLEGPLRSCRTPVAGPREVDQTGPGTRTASRGGVPMRLTEPIREEHRQLLPRLESL